MKNIAITIILFLAPAFTCLSQGITPDQQKRLQKYFDTNKKLVGVSKPIIEELIGEQPNFLGSYSDALTAIDILNKVANAEDAQALETIVLYYEGKLVEKLMPGLNSVLSYASWVKTGMELFKDFVFNPALLSEANETYYNNRKKVNLDPDLAISNIRAWGNIEQQLMAEFRKEYGDHSFKEIKPSGLVLLPKWKSKFDRYVTAWFENQYQIRRIEEFQKEAKEKINKNNQSIQGKSDYLDYLIEKKLKELHFLSISPSSKTIKINESVSFLVNAINKGGDKSDVTSKALSKSVFTGTNKGIFTITATFETLSISSTITVSDVNNCKENETWDAVIEDCICKSGFERNESGECIVIDTASNINIIPPIEITIAEINNQLNSADCANVPDAVAKWDIVSEQVICTCTKDYYTWDAGQKKCVANVQAILANSDCSQWLNTEPKWDYGTNEPYCDCVSGYEWNDDYTKCISKQEQLINQADCSQHPNTQPILDPVSKEVICDCLPGFEWDEDYTKCILKALAEMQNFDCSMFPNTEPILDPVSQQTYCDCSPGYKWNEEYTACEQIQQQQPIQYDCSHLPNSRPIFDAVLNEFVCDCMPGYQWNSGQSGCILIPRKPTVDWGSIINMTMDVLNAVNGNTQGIMPPGYNPGTGGQGLPQSMQPPVRHQSNCNDQQQAGGDPPEEHTIDLGQSYGSFMFDYNTVSQKDQIIVTNGGVTIFNSGCVGESKSIRLQLKGYSPTITVRVNPNCEGGSGTQWYFTVHCPEN